MRQQITCSELADLLPSTDLIILDAGMVLPGKEEDYSPAAVIRGARRFDIKHTFADTQAPWPNTCCDAKQFTAQAQALGINNDSHIVVYDDQGLFSAARAWWMFKHFGFDKVQVLKGGLPAWRTSELPVQQGWSDAPAPGNFTVTQKRELFIDEQHVLEHIDNPHSLLLDARTAKRFSGEAAEPREGMRSGHIPESKNLPYVQLIKDGALKSTDQLKPYFDALAKDAHTLQFSCGSGITACILALAAYESGYDQLYVFDGSWAQWGASEHLPLEQGS